jgi:hypothetical protein
MQKIQCLIMNLIIYIRLNSKLIIQSISHQKIKEINSILFIFVLSKIL